MKTFSSGEDGLYLERTEIVFSIWRDDDYMLRSEGGGTAPDGRALLTLLTNMKLGQRNWMGSNLVNIGRRRGIL